jgi:hypothetical protein
LFFQVHNDRVVTHRFTKTFSAICAAGNERGIIVIDHCTAHAR